ncbi:MAG: GGDEF domain-containing protein [Dehalococcoidia bacterium]|nr:GGDEF domain-containing protein [Dehalococcoidia bacterium]
MAEKTSSRWRRFPGFGDARSNPDGDACAQPPPAPGRQTLLDQVAREIARSERAGTAVSLAMVELSGAGEIAARLGPLAAGAAMAHLKGALGRVTWADDYVADEEGGRFAVVLVDRGGDNGARFTQRVAMSVANRAVAGPRGSLRVVTDVVEYSRARHHDPETFLGAATGEAPSQFMPSPSAYAELRKARRADPHELRRQLGLKAPAGTPEPRGRLLRGFRT